MRKLINERRNLNEKVKLMQIQLEDLYRENYNFACSLLFKITSNQFKNNSELLFDLIRTFNLNQSNNEYLAIMKSSILLNNYLFDFKIEDFLKTSNQIQISSAFKNILKEYFLFSINLKSKAFIFENLLNSYEQLKQKSKDMYKININYILLNESENFIQEYRSIFKICIKKDKNNLGKYLGEILKRNNMFVEKYNTDYFIKVNF